MTSWQTLSTTPVPACRDNSGRFIKYQSVFQLALEDLTAAWLSEETPSRNLFSGFLSPFLNFFPLSAKREEFTLGKAGSGGMVVALLSADFLHSDPRCSRKIVTTAKRERAENRLEMGINLTLGRSPQIRASEVRLDGSQTRKASP